jgi:hypothetical protein
VAQPQNEPQMLALVATEPLSLNENWVVLPEGQVTAFRNGVRVQ